MSNEYFTRLVNDDGVDYLIKKGLVNINSEGQEIQFKNGERVKIHPLYVEENEDGALIVKVNGQTYIFYLEGFGQVGKIASTASMIKLIVSGLLDNDSNVTSRMLSIDDCGAIRVVSRDRTVESTSVFSKNILGNIQWLFRGLLRSRIKEVNLKE